MSRSRHRRFKGTTEQVNSSRSSLPGRHRPSSRTEEIILLRKAYPKKYGSQANNGFPNKARKKISRSLEPLTNNATTPPSRPKTSFGLSGNQSLSHGFTLGETTLRPHTVGGTRFSSPLRPGTGLSMSMSMSLRPSSSGSSVVQVEDYIRMQQQCGELQQRLERIESKIDEGYVDSGKGRSKAPDDEPGILPTHLGIRFNQMEGVLDRLETVFLDRDELMRVHWRMATKINSVIRKYLAYKRFKKGKLALSRWRQRVALPFMNLIEAHIKRQTDIHFAENTIQTKSGLKLVQKCITAWYKYTLKKMPSNREKIRKALEMAMIQSNQLTLLVFSAWKRCAQSKGSRKNVALFYKKRLIDARVRIKQSGKVEGVVTPAALKREMRADATKRIRRRKLDYIKLRALYAWQEAALAKNYRLLRIAKRHFFKKYVAPCFYAWQNYINQLDRLGAARKSLQVPRFRPKFNLDAVTLFYRRNTISKVLKKWFKFAHPRAVVRRHLEATATLLCSKVIKVWASQTKWQVEAKRLCVAEWRDYAKRICSAPFMAWFLWKEKRRTRATASTAIVSAFNRRQKYRKVYQIFRLWKHLSIYGKAEGLKSRIALLRALDQQNKFARTLEGTIDQLQDELESTEQALTEQENANHTQLERQLKLESKCEKYKFALHSAEQEIARLQTLMDCLRNIYPATVKRVEGHQTKEAPLTPFSRKRAKDTVPIAATEPSNTRPETADTFDSTSTAVPKDMNATIAAEGEAIILNNIKASGDATPYHLRDANPLGSSGSVANPTVANGAPANGASDRVLSSVSVEDMTLLRRAKLVLGEFGLLPGSEVDPDDVGTLGEVQQDILRFIGTGSMEQQKSEKESPPLLTQMAERSTWNDFLQDLNMHHPMKHPLNSTAKERIQTRIAHAKNDSRLNFGQRVNVYSRAGFEDEEHN